MGVRDRGQAGSAGLRPSAPRDVGERLVHDEVTSLSVFFPGVELWTGIKKGPPRKLKFPEPQEVVKELKKYLS